MADLAITTIPSAVQAVLYIPEVYNGPRYGSYFPERRTNDSTKATVVADIASAQHDDVRRVIAIDLSAGTSWDASKEIAHAVLDVVLTDYQRIPAWCVEFLENHLGVGFVAAVEREAA